MEHRRDEYRGRGTKKSTNSDVTVSMRKERRDMLHKRIRLRDSSNINTNVNNGQHQYEQQREERMNDNDNDDIDNILNKILCNIQDPSTTTKLQGLTKLRQLTCTSNWPVDRVIATGVIDYIISLLTSSDHNIQYESIWCLTNIASGDHHQTALVLKAVPVLLQILSGTNPNLQDQASWTIGNIAGDSDEFRQVLIANGAVKPLMDYALVSASTSLNSQHNEAFDSYCDRARTAVWALSNITRGTTPAAEFMNLNAMTSLIALMVTHTDKKLSNEICWIFTFLSAKEIESVEKLVDLGLIQALISVAEASDYSTLEPVPALRCLGNLSSGLLPWIDVILNTQTFLSSLARIGSLPCTLPDYTIVLKEVLRVVANMFGGTPIHKQILVGNGILEIIIRGLSVDSFDTQREAVRGLQNACDTSAGGDTSAVERIASEVPALMLLMKLMKAPDISMALGCMRIVRLVLIQFNDLIEACAKDGLFDILDELHYTNTDEEICRTAAAMSDELCELFEDTDLISYEPGNDKEDSFIFNSNSTADGTAVFNFGGGRGGAGRGQHLLKPSWME